jgi:hypothetical protein
MTIQYSFIQDVVPLTGVTLSEGGDTLLPGLNQSILPVSEGFRCSAVAFSAQQAAAEALLQVTVQSGHGRERYHVYVDRLGGDRCGGRSGALPQRAGYDPGEPQLHRPSQRGLSVKRIHRHP